MRKLGFLKRVMDRDANCLSGSVVLALCGDVDSLCLVRECRELEESFGTCFTERITSKEVCCLREIKKSIVDVDRRMLLEKCAEKAPLIVKVAEHPGWAKLWDHSLDLGWKAVLGLQMLSSAMSHHGRGKQLCHLCEVETLKEDTVLEHVLANHHGELHLPNSSFDCSDLLSMISNLNLEILSNFKRMFFHI